MSLLDWEQKSYIGTFGEVLCPLGIISLHFEQMRH